MYDAPTIDVPKTRAAALQRANGRACVSYKKTTTGSRLDDLHQSGCAKVRLPKIYEGPPVAVLINTAGGLTGGDRLIYEASVQKGARAIVASQTAERAYKSASGVARAASRLDVADGGSLEWLPQEVILFNRSALHRSMDVTLEGNARLLAVESVVVGRTAMGETVDRVDFRDRWRIRRDGKLVFADDARLDGDPGDILTGRAATAGMIAFATLVDCGPAAEERIGQARSILERLEIRAAASAWNGLLTARFVASDGRALRDGLMTFLKAYRAAELPRVWTC
jgi:urease accessory protein